MTGGACGAFSYMGFKAAKLGWLNLATPIFTTWFEPGMRRYRGLAGKLMEWSGSVPAEK